MSDVKTRLHRNKTGGGAGGGVIRSSPDIKTLSNP